jgi:lipoprotein-anchoring transpeptidase ErfK/SrfK
MSATFPQQSGTDLAAVARITGVIGTSSLSVWRGRFHGWVGQKWVDRLMTMRALAFVMLAAVALSGCMQDVVVSSGTLDPSSDANWKQRDKDLMSNLPYNQSAVSETYRRHLVDYHRKEAPGTIVVDSDNRFLYYVLAKGQAIRYGIAVGEEAQAWSGVAKIGRMEEWPAWHPTPGEQARLGPLPEYVTGGPHNPMGSRGMYLYANNKDTLYRIHGTNQPEYIGSAVSSGCIRMTNEDAIDLYNHVKSGTMVIVLAPHQNDGVFGARVASAWGSSTN